MKFASGSHFMVDIMKAAEKALSDGVSHVRVAGYLEDLAMDVRDAKREQEEQTDDRTPHP
mgnify:CR=1 FL=1